METRTLVIGAEVRAAGEFCIVGKALSYNRNSPDNQLGPGLRERIAPGCFRESLAKGGEDGDVKCLVNHAADNILGRRKNGTLQLTDGADALRFRVQLNPKSQAHKDIYESVKRGDLNECSFAFVPQEQEYLNDTDTSGKPCKTRVIRKASLLDVSIVTYPFYSNEGSTDAQARAEMRAAQSKLGTHGLKVAIETLRKATKMSSRTLRADSSPIDFASHLQRCHEYGEFLESQLDEALGVSNADDEDVDEKTRGAFLVARAACRIHNENMAIARLYHGSKKKK
jgi:uncharacterized protein